MSDSKNQNDNMHYNKQDMYPPYDIIYPYEQLDRTIWYRNDTNEAVVQWCIKCDNIGDNFGCTSNACYYHQ